MTTTELNKELIEEIAQIRAGKLKEISWRRLIYKDLNGIDFSGLDLSGAYINESRFIGANFTGCDLYEVYGKLSNFREANLSNANLRFANLADADLSDANLRGANLTYVDLTSVRGLHLADLTGVVGLSTPAEEMELLVAIKQEIVARGRLDMNNWHHTDRYSYDELDALIETLTEIPGSCYTPSRQVPKLEVHALAQKCGTVHCLAGSAHLLAYLKGNEGVFEVSAARAGSTLIPSMAPYFMVTNTEAVEILDQFISGERPLLKR